MLKGRELSTSIRAWTTALSVSAAATGFSFTVSAALGVALTCLTVFLVVRFLAWAVHRGQLARSTGRPPDHARLQRHWRYLAKWGMVLEVLVVATFAAAIVTSNAAIPVWLLVAPVVLITVGVALLCVFAWLVLPRLQAGQSPAP